ncbi:MAG: guanine nucleotide-binding protein (G protein) subunit beta-like protein [Amphiamblys sp. WSBS2006]|nr:MAG: guanine nucleotide-binding protein (G protein) subunit beta-like protein [Amphiamblys sp. WSBS2006]
MAISADGKKLKIKAPDKKLRGHAGGIVSLFRTARYLFSGDSEGHVVVWNSQHRKLHAKRICKHVMQLCFLEESPECILLGVQERGGVISIWQFCDGGKDAGFILVEKIDACCVSYCKMKAKGGVLAYPDKDGGVSLYETKTGLCRRGSGDMAKGGMITCVDFYGEDRLCLCNENGEIAVYNTETNRSEKVIQNIKETIMCCAVYGENCLVGYGEGKIAVHNVRDESIFDVFFSSSSGVSDISIGEDMFYTCDWQGRVRLFSKATFSLRGVFCDHMCGVDAVLSCFSDGVLYSGDRNGQVFVWRLESKA